MISALAARKGQVLLCGTEALRLQAAALFPDLAVVMPNGDYTPFEGRSCVAFGVVIAQLVAGYAAKTKIVPEPFPEVLTKEWIKQNAVPIEDYLASIAVQQNPVAQVPDADSSPAEGGNVAVKETSSLPSPSPVAAGPSTEPQDARSEPPPWSDEDTFPPEATIAPPGPAGEGWQGVGDWPAPMDYWGDSAALPLVQPGMLPPWLMDYVMDQAALRGVDPVQPALQCLLAISGALHNSLSLRPKPGEPDYIERPVLWGATVGLPSCKKDAGQAIAVGPLMALDTDMRRATAKRMQEQGDAQASYEDALVVWRKGKSVGERPQPPEPTDQDRLLVDSFTTEGLRSVLQHNSRGKVLVAVPELAGMFGNADAYSKNNGASKDLPLILRLYESRPLIVDRAAPVPPVYVKSWAASIAGAIQPRVLARLSNSLHMTEDGMLARLLVVMSKNGNEGEERPVDALAASAYKSMIAAAVALHPYTEPCRFSRNAQAVRTEFVKWVYRTAGSGVLPDGLAAAVGKFEGSFSRLCLVVHAAECAHARMAVIAPEISHETAERVRNLIWGLLYPHASTFYAQLSPESSGVGIQRLIAGFILATGAERINLTNLWQSITQWRHTQQRVQRESLQALVECGWLRQNTKGYAVNPCVHSVFPEQAKAELERRQKYASVLNEKLGRVSPSREAGED